MKGALRRGTWRVLWRRWRGRFGAAPGGSYGGGGGQECYKCGAFDLKRVMKALSTLKDSPRKFFFHDGVVDRRAVTKDILDLFAGDDDFEPGVEVAMEAVARTKAVTAAVTEVVVAEDTV
ncbi:hypothetical protein G7Y79_00046g082230 [Physcia stellaris]|nr:hypothetical protein G7Y79_00046g082230 [Physcia stellaris]